MNEHNFRVPSHRKQLFLFISQNEDYFFVFLSVLLRCREWKYFCHFHTLAVVYYKTRSASCSFYFWDLAELYPCQPFYCWWFDLLFVISLKVIQIAKLARLAHSLSTNETLVTIEAQTVVNCAAKTHIEQNCTNCGSSSTFPRVAVNNNHIFWVLWKDKILNSFLRWIHSMDFLQIL